MDQFPEDMSVAERTEHECDLADVRLDMIGEGAIDLYDDDLTKEELDQLLTPEDNRPAWLASRNSFIGASEAAAVLDMHPYLSPYELWARKRGILAEDQGNEFSQFGIDFEPVLAQKFVERTGLNLLRNVPTLFHPDHPFIGYTPDGLIDDDATFEGKTFGFRKAHLWGDEGTDQVPREHWVQAQQGLMVTARKVCRLYAFNRDECLYHLYEIPANLEFQSELLLAEVAWWNHHVVGDFAPDPDGSESCTEAIKQRWKLGMELSIVAPEQLEIEIDRLLALKAEIKAAEKLETELSNLIRVHMAEATILTLSGSEQVTWRNNKASEKVDWENVALDYRRVLERRRVLVPRTLDNIRFRRTEVKPGPRVLRLPTRKEVKVAPSKAA